MPTVTPATIYYTHSSGAEHKLNFDAVISETHQTTAKITKFPIQEGFHVSNHSIRDNREIRIKGSITNMKFDLGDDEPKTDYGLNATGHVKQVIDTLIQQATQCRVITNLGIYDPVIFKSFKTQQKKGLVDSMEFEIAGEEIVRANAVSFAAPTPIAFTEISGAEKDVVIEELSTKHIYVKRSARILRGAYRVGQDFSIQGVTASGTPVTTTYIFLGIDPTTGAEKYQTHISENSVTLALTSLAQAKIDTCAEAGFPKSKGGGIEQISSCILQEASNILLGNIEETIDTAMGRLTRSARGLLYDTVEFAGGQDSSGGMLVTAGTECVVRGISGNTDPGNYNPGESLPTTAQIMQGAAEGLGFTEPVAKSVSLIQIRCANTGEVQPDVNTLLIPLTIG